MTDRELMKQAFTALIHSLPNGLEAQSKRMNTYAQLSPKLQENNNDDR